MEGRLMGDWATVLGARPRMGAVGVCCVLGSTGGHMYPGAGLSPPITPRDRTAPTGRAALDRRAQEGKASRGVKK